MTGSDLAAAEALRPFGGTMLSLRIPSIDQRLTLKHTKDMQTNTQKTPPGTGGQDTRMSLYEKLREVPQSARKPIGEGRLKGKTDINTMWRMKRLTEVFGPCGIGWKYTVDRQWLEAADANTVAAFVNVTLAVKDPDSGEWSAGIPGTGGNVFKRLENSGKLYMDDDCFKKALSDAIGTASKALGLGADVYYETDTGKYTQKSLGPAYRTRETPAQASDVRTVTAKEVLTPSSRYWLQSVSIAMSTSDGPAAIRTRIEKKFSISDDDFLLLMKRSGKLPENATSIPA